MDHSRLLIHYFRLFNPVGSKQKFFMKVCRWLDLNHGPLVSETTALPTEPQPLLTFPIFCRRCRFRLKRFVCEFLYVVVVACFDRKKVLEISHVISSTFLAGPHQMKTNLPSPYAAPTRISSKSTSQRTLTEDILNCAFNQRTSIET